MGANAQRMEYNASIIRKGSRSVNDMNIEKHAYMILCHTNPEQVCMLLDLLDDVRNDIYLHVDKNASDFPQATLPEHVKKAGLFFIDPIRISWGGDSITRAELLLLKEAVKTPHSYYHLISGADLPLKTQDEIHKFFASCGGKDFVGYVKDLTPQEERAVLDRVDYYYPFQNRLQRYDGSFLWKLQLALVKLQKIARLRRTVKYGIQFAKGINWFSITHDTALFILGEYPKYEHVFQNTFCSDELFVQTILQQSERISNVVKSSLRMEDWKRGNPYTFREEDFDLLMNGSGDKIFARKFDEKVDKAVIEKIYNTLKSAQN